MAQFEQTSKTVANGTSPSCRDGTSGSARARTGARRISAGDRHLAAIDGGNKGRRALTDKTAFSLIGLARCGTAAHCHDLTPICPTLAGNDDYLSVMSINVTLKREPARIETHFSNCLGEVRRAMNLKFRDCPVDFGPSQGQGATRGERQSEVSETGAITCVWSGAKGEKTYYAAV